MRARCPFLSPLRRARALAAGCLLLAAGPLPALAAEVAPVERPRRQVVVAVTAYDEPAVIERQLQPLLTLLAQVLPDIRVELAISNQDGVEALVRGNRADAVLTNPYHYLRLRHSDMLSGVLATVRRASPTGSVGSLGGTIVVAADNSAITQLPDLRGRRVAIADRRSTGGFLLPLGELQRAGVRREELQWLEAGSGRAAVDAVLAGEADAAFLRGALLEALRARGALSAGALRVLNRQSLGDYPFAVSTRLYPEWPLVFVAGSDMEALTRIFGVALQRPFRLRIDTPGAIAGLGLPAEYEPLRELVRELRLPPHDREPEVSLAEIWQVHRSAITALGIAVLAVLLMALVLLRSNRRLLAVSRQLNRALAERERDARRLADLNRHFEAVLDRSTDFIYFKDPERRFVFASRSLAALAGWRRRREVEGRGSAEVFPGDADSVYERMENAVLHSGEAVEDFRQQYRRPDGTAGAISLHMWPVTGQDGAVLGLFAIGRDVTEKHAQELALERAANYDALTGLPNRNLFFDRLRQAMATCERRNTEICLVYLDLDNLKPVNDTLGHAAGDELLQRLAERLQGGLRKSDTVARLGGDEFVLLLAEFGSRRECTSLLERILQRLAEPLPIAGTSVEITASAGLAFFGAGHDTDADHLLRQADQAMYRAKEAGRNCYRIIDAQQDSELRAFLERVATGIAENHFELYYQPLVDMRSGDIAGVEALLRWRDESGQLLTPDRFLPLLNSHPLARDLDSWVLRNATAQLRRWHDAGLSLTLHVNVTASDISEPLFGQRLRHLLSVQGISRGLCLEILESAAMADAAAVNRVIADCEGQGVSFALDDFGTGYSSLSHIKDLRADCVKIDKRFVQAVFHSHDDFSLLAAIIAMARAFDRSLVAEGVETEAQGAMLLRLGCRVAQGYFIARPMPAGELQNWRAQWRPPASWSALAADLSVHSGEASEQRLRAWEAQVAGLAAAPSGER